MNAEDIRHRLESLQTVHDLRSLLIEGLNYEYRDQTLLPQDVLSDAVRGPVQKMRIIAGYSDFEVILCTLDRLLKTSERPIAQQVVNRYFHSLIVFTDTEHSEWHLCNLKHIEKDRAEEQEIARRIRPFRRMVVGETERYRTTSEQLLKTVTESGDSGLDLHMKMDAAFDVEAVSRSFYKDFVSYYKQFRDLLKQKNDLPQERADILTQTIFNRLLFLYYVQKRGFLDNNPRYLYEQFRDCPPDVNYYQSRLVPLFRRLSDASFEAPELGDVPFLNGGLFEFDPAEQEIEVENGWFETVYRDLLERYNFTVREDTEFEQEVAVDPEMLGTVFEQLILGLESKEFKDIPDPRRGSGSYYTPKFIVAFMVKESLLVYLQEKLSGISRGKLKRLVYDLEADGLAKAKLEQLRDALVNLKAVDPAIGSGAFAVGLLLKMVEIIEVIDHVLTPNEVEAPDYRYNLKRSLIEKTIYGVDIQARAVHLSELRLWLSLLVEVPEPEPLPNLDLHIMTGDSLVSKIGGVVDFNLERQVRLDATGETLIDRFKKMKTDYETVYDRVGKQVYREKLTEAKREIIRWFLEARKKAIEQRLPQLALMDEAKAKEREQLERHKDELVKLQRLLDSLDELTGTFNWGLDFAEIMTLNGGFDLVIGNPPYGVKVPRKVKDEFGLGSRDSYGVFTTLGLTILRTHGSLCYIMSDTWQTIRTHKKLRDRLLTETDVRYLVSVPNDTFKAMVNPGVYLFRKRHASEQHPGGDNWILAADFSPLSIKNGDVEVAFELLAEIESEKLDQTKDGMTLWSDREMAIFAYRQKLIPRFSNHSFFIASPKLFRLVRDVGNLKAGSRRQPRQQNFFPEPEQTNFFDDMSRPPVYAVDFNGKELELAKLGDVADVVVGLQTGDNKYYLRQSQERLPGSSRNYDAVYFDLVLQDEQLEHTAKTEALRLAVIQVGIVEDLDQPQFGPLTVRFKPDGVEVHEGTLDEIKSKQTLLRTYERRTDVETPDGDVVVHPKDRYFDGRYFVPYDKGGASDIEEGWLPNYWVSTDYFIDWSEEAVGRLRTLTIADKVCLYNENKQLEPEHETTTCAVLRNTDYYFQTGISFSDSGVYSPTFRISVGSVFDQKGSMIFPRLPTNSAKLISILPSRLSRCLLKCFVNHSVSSHVNSIKNIIIPVNPSSTLMAKLTKMFSQIKRRQQIEPRYDYLASDQVEINRLVYQMYNLNDKDIAEVENWFWRRYPNLATAIEAKRNN